MNSYIRTTLVLCLSCISACGGADSAEQMEPMTEPGREGNAGRGGTTGPTAGIPNLADVLMPMCNPDAESVTNCGGVDCPELPENAAATCTINCCSTDNRCGTLSSETRIEMVLGTACTPPALEDPRCPSSSLFGSPAPGCCLGDGNCGQLIANVCIPSGMTRACDAEPAPPPQQ